MTFSFPPLEDKTLNDIIINDFEEVSDAEPFIQSKLFLNNDNILISLENLKLIDIKINNTVYHMIFEIADEKTYNFFYKLDKKILKFVRKQTNLIFKKKDNNHCINNYFRSNLDLPLNFNSNPLLKVRVPIEKGNIKTKFFDINNKPIPISDIKEGDKLNILVKINSINFLESYFFIDQILYQAKSMTSNLSYTFLSETDSEPDILLSDQET